MNDDRLHDNGRVHHGDLQRVLAGRTHRLREVHDARVVFRILLELPAEVRRLGSSARLRGSRASVRAAQVAEAQAWKVDTLAGYLKPAQDVASFERRADLWWKDAPLVLPAVASEATQFPGVGAVAGEQCSRFDPGGRLRKTDHSDLLERRLESHPRG